MLYKNVIIDKTNHVMYAVFRSNKTINAPHKILPVEKILEPELIHTLYGNIGSYEYFENIDLNKYSIYYYINLRRRHKRPRIQKKWSKRFIEHRFLLIDNKELADIHCDDDGDVIRILIMEGVSNNATTNA